MRLYITVMTIIFGAVQVCGQNGINIIPGSSGVREMIKSLGKAKDSASILSTLLLLNPRKINAEGKHGIVKNGDKYEFNFTDSKLMDLLHDKNGSKLISVNQVEMTGSDMNVPLLGGLLQPQRHLEIAAIDTSKSNTTITKNRGADFMKLLLGLTQVAGSGANQIFKSIGMGSVSVVPGKSKNDKKEKKDTDIKVNDAVINKSKQSAPKSISNVLPRRFTVQPLGVSDSKSESKAFTTRHHKVKRRTTKISWGPGFTVSYASSPLVKIVDTKPVTLADVKEKLENNQVNKNLEPSNSAQNDENPIKVMDSEIEKLSNVADEGKDQKTLNKGISDSTNDKGRSQLDMYNFKNRPLFLKSAENEKLHHEDKDGEKESPIEPKFSHISNQAQMGHEGYIQAPGNSPPYYIGQDVPYNQNVGYSNYNQAFPQVLMQQVPVNGNPNTQFNPGYNYNIGQPYAQSPGSEQFVPGNDHLPSQEIPSLYNVHNMPQDNMYQQTEQGSTSHFDPTNGPYQNQNAGGQATESSVINNEANQLTKHYQNPRNLDMQQSNIQEGIPENSQAPQHQTTQFAHQRDQQERSSQDGVKQEIEGKPIYTDKLPPDSIYPPLEAQALPPYQDRSHIENKDSHGQSASNQVLMASNNPINPNHPDFSNNYGYGVSPSLEDINGMSYMAQNGVNNGTENMAPQNSYTPPYYYHQGVGATDGRDSFNYNEAIAAAAGHPGNPYQYGTEGMPAHMISPTNNGPPYFEPASNYHSSPTADYLNAPQNNQNMGDPSSRFIDSTTKERPSIAQQQSIFQDIKSRSGGRYPPYMTQSGYSQSDSTNLRQSQGGIPTSQEIYAQPINSPIPTSNNPILTESNAAQVNEYDTFQEGQNQRIPYGNIDETPGDDETSLLDAEYLRARSFHRPGLEGTTTWVNNAQSSNTGYVPNPIPTVNNMPQEVSQQGLAAQASDIVAQAKSAFNQVSGQASYVQSSNLGTQFSGYPKAQPPASKHYQTNAIIGVQVKCNLNRNELIFTVHFKDRFYGLVYTKGYYQVEQCRTRGQGSQTVSLVLPLDGCGNTIVSQGWDLSSGVTTFVSRLVIIFDTNLGIITSHDTAYKATCTLGGAGSPALESGIQVPMLLPNGMQPSAMVMPPAWMSIVQGKDPQAPPSQILNLGQIGTVVIKLHDTQGNFDIYAYNCFAHDGMGMGRIQLLDYNGCPIHTQIVGPQSREVVHGSLSIFFHFKVFKFPDVNNVYFVCEIKICYKKCQQPSCGLFTASKHKRKRRSLSEIYSPDIPLHEVHNKSYFTENVIMTKSLKADLKNSSNIVHKLGESNSLPITNTIDGIKTSTIFQSIMVKIPLELEEEEEIDSKDLHPTIINNGFHEDKLNSYDSVNEGGLEATGQVSREKTIVYKDGGVLRTSPSFEKREVCVSKTAFATSLGTLFAFVVIITTFALYQLSKREIKKFSSKLSSFDNQDYYDNSCEKDSKQILPFEFGSVRSSGSGVAYQQTSFDGGNKNQATENSVLNNKNTFPLRLKPTLVHNT